MKEKLRIFIEENLEKEQSFLFKASKVREANFAGAVLCDECANIDEFINNNKDESKFQTLLFKYIDERNLKDSDVYNKVNIDRRLFSKIRSDAQYHPSKETIILLGLSLELSEKELMNLLESASYSLPKNNYFDLIIRFCFINKIYKIDEVNELLYDYNCKCL